MSTTVAPDFKWSMVTPRGPVVANKVTREGVDTCGCTWCDSECVGVQAAAVLLCGGTGCLENRLLPLLPPSQSFLENSHLAAGFGNHSLIAGWKGENSSGRWMTHLHTCRFTRKGSSLPTLLTWRIPWLTPDRDSKVGNLVLPQMIHTHIM